MEPLGSPDYRPAPRWLSVTLLVALVLGVMAALWAVVIRLAAPAPEQFVDAVYGLATVVCVVVGCWTAMAVAQ